MTRISALPLKLVLSQSEENQLINSKKDSRSTIIHHQPTHATTHCPHTHARLSPIGGDENKVKATEPCMCDIQKRFSSTVSAPL